MDLAEPYKELDFPPFPVRESKWTHRGFEFFYSNSSENTLSVLVSITYTPKWKAFLDDQPLPVHRLDNLICIKLTPGEHRVLFDYGMTWIGWLGIAVTLSSFINISLLPLQCTRGIFS